MVQLRTLFCYTFLMQALARSIKEIYSKNSLLFYLFIFLGIFMTLLIGQNIYLVLSSGVQNIITQYRQGQRRKESEANYEALVKAQALAAKKPSVTPTPQRYAHGTFDLSIVFVRPPTLSQRSIDPLLATLNDRRSYLFESNASLAFIPSFLMAQAARYNVSDFHITLHTWGPYAIGNLQKVGDFAYEWNRDPFGVAKVQDAFEKVLGDNKVPTNPLTLFLYFDDSFERPADSRPDSFYEEKKFRSFANPDAGRAYINVYEFSPTFSVRVAEVATHELLHLFGASDKYVEDPSAGKVCTDKGRGEPMKEPPLPQATGDIMCLFVEGSDGSFKRGRIENGNLVINDYTAREIGWKE